MDGFSFCAVADVPPGKFATFVGAVFPGRDPGAFWWRRNPHTEALARAAIDLGSGAMAGLCVGVPSVWDMPVGGRRVVSICDWFVHRDFRGLGLGKAMVAGFDDQASVLNSFSVSAAACENFARLGWQGPWTSGLWLLPVPAVFRRRIAPGFAIARYHATNAALPAELALALDTIDRHRPPGQARRRRDAASWRAHLSVAPRRRYDFGVLLDAGAPVAYWAIRATDGEADAAYRLARLHYVSDVMCNTADPQALKQCAIGIAGTAPVSAGALLLCTTDRELAAALGTLGWIGEGESGLGARLAGKAPRYMSGGELKSVAPADVRLTFADADLDFNI